MPRLLERQLPRRRLLGVRNWLGSGLLAGFNALVLLSTIAIVAELFGDAWPLWGKIVVVALTVVLSSVTFWVQFHRPSLLTTEKQRKRVIEEIVFETMINRIDDLLTDQPVIRCNVMLMQRNVLGYPKHLRIAYASQGRREYSGVELSQTWEVGTGCSGWAYEAKEQTIFDAASRQAARRGMSPSQSEATQHTRSILSTPIFRADRDPRLENPIGVLNLDSEEPITKTHLDDPTILDIVAGYASVIGALL